MAALTSNAVDLQDSSLGSPEFFPFGLGNRGIIGRRLKLVLTGQGGQTNTIGAEALGFDRLLMSNNLFDDANNKVYPAAVDPVTNTLVLADGSAAPAPVDVTSSAAYVTVIGTAKVAI